MMKKDSLHDLIHSMTRQEKRYFKLFIGEKQGEQRSKYSLLFDLLAEMEAFDQEKLKANFAWVNFRSSYTMAKRYLHDKILESLAAYQTPDTSAQQLEVLIQQIRILRNKQLYKQVSRKIALAKRLAYKVQDNIHLLEILIEERSLMIHNARSVFQGNALLRLNEEMEATTAGIRLEQQVQHLQYQFFTRMSHPTRQALTEVAGYLEELKALNVLDRDGFMSKISYYVTLNQYHFFNSDYVDSQQALAKAVALFRDHPEMISEHPSPYLGLVHNYANRCILLSDHQPVIECLKLLRDFPVRNNKLENQRLESYFGMGLLLILNSGQTNENQGFLELILSEIRKPKPRLSLRFLLNLKWMISIWHLQAGDCKVALTWTKEVMQDPAHTAIKVYSHLLSLVEMIIHFELGNEDWLEYRLRSHQIQLNKSSAYAFEKLFVKHLKAIIREPDSVSREQAFGDFLANVKVLNKDPNEHAVFTFFDFEAWVTSKVQKITFQQAIQQDWANKGGIEIRIV